MTKKLLSEHLDEYFSNQLPYPEANTATGWWCNKQWSMSQMMWAVDNYLGRVLMDMEIAMPKGYNGLNEVRQNLRKVSLMLKYAQQNSTRWKEENISYSELCAYIDIELLKSYPDEQHTPETIPA
jgi:hypothetical protein